MQNRISDKFVELRKQDRIALIPFFTAGYPTTNIFMKLVREAARSGASMIEIGIPFSDPLADGSVIQYSSQQALKKCINLTKILKLIRVLSGQVAVPLVIMSYYNPILQFGLERFCQQAKRAGVAGLIIPDLPPDESSMLEEKARQYDLDLVYLLAPNATEKRIKLVTGRARGFIYLVSVTGVTGARNKLPPALLTFIRRVRRFTRQPLCLGFGVSNPQQIKTLRKWVDGVIIGSAIIELIRKEKSSLKTVTRVGNFIAVSSTACRSCLFGNLPKRDGGMKRFCKETVK